MEKIKVPLRRSSGNALLRVGEAQTRDVGRGIARLDPAVMKQLGVDIGDFLHISTPRGKECTVVKVMPSFLDERKKGLIQIDGLIRENAAVNRGENVSVQKIEPKIGNMVVLSPLTAAPGTGEEYDYLQKLLAGMAVTKGDTIRVSLFGTQSRDFSVIDTDPSPETVIIGTTTRVKIKGAQETRRRSVGMFYEDIGGLERELHRIREMIELPLKYPEIFKRLGIEAPKGVLLYGPPGCGKTLIAKAVANETDAYFLHVSGPEIVNKFYGESEARLRELFEEAKRNVPAIIFIDEIDSIAPKRAEVTGEVEKRIVAQLLALMDGISDRGQVIVIGATNIPNSLDPALRRPGRFDREITIGIPDVMGREKILEIHTQGMPLTPDVHLRKLAETTHGFVGADLQSFAREAAMAALRRVMPDIELEKDSIPSATLEKLEVRSSDFDEALKVVEPSALREVCIEVPDVQWADVGGLEEVKHTLRQAVEWPLRHPHLFEQAAIAPSKGILLHGSPGCGKTLLAKAVSHECGVNFISVKGPALLSKYVGESEKGVREIFQKARQASPCIVFFDELDSLLPRRGGGSDSHVSERVVCQFLAELDGIEELKGVVILGATNRIDLIDPALLRPGRFDFLLEIPQPDEESLLEILKIHTRHKPLTKDVRLEELVTHLDGWNGADIEMLCRTAALLAIETVIGSDAHTKTPAIRMTSKHFQSALAEMQSRRGQPFLAFVPSSPMPARQPSSV